jgi:predicted hotdog family 3-hydroxylacyl-ACP dehydratase
MDIYPKPEQIIPHRPPILMLRSLQQIDGTGAAAKQVFREGDYAVEGERVTESALIECLAQAVAAIPGFAARHQGRSPAPGMLVGVEDFEALAQAKAGHELDIVVKITRSLGPFSLAEGSISQDGVAVARGCLKLYLEEDRGNAPTTA